MTGFDRLVVGDAELEQDQQKADFYRLRDTLQQTQPLAQAQYRQSLDSQAQSTLDTLQQIRPQVEHDYRLGLDTAAKSLLNVFGQTRDWLGQAGQAAGQAIGGARAAPDEAVQQLTRYTPFNVAATVGQQIPEAAQALTERVTQGANQPVGGGPEGVPLLSGLANPHTVLPPLAGLAAGALLTPGGGEAGAAARIGKEAAPAAEAAAPMVAKLGTRLTESGLGERLAQMGASRATERVAQAGKGVVAGLPPVEAAAPVAETAAAPFAGPMAELIGVAGDPAVQAVQARLLERAAKAPTPTDWPQALMTIYRANLLSNPLTQARNIVGNIGAAALAPIERLGAATIEAGRVPVTKALRAALPKTDALLDETTPRFSLGAPERQRYFGEALAQIQPWITGWRAALDEAGAAWSGVAQGLAKAETGRQGLADVTIAGRRLGGVGTAIETPFRALSAGDAFFGKMAEESEKRVLAYRMASQEGLSGDALASRVADLVADPTGAMTKTMESARAYRTYNTALTGIAKDFSSIVQAGPLQVLTPFLRTPLNILGFELERSPLGFVGVGKGIRASESAGEVADRLARWTMGMGISIWGGYQAAHGNLTGAAPKNSSERDRFYREGKQEYSVRVGNNWHSYSQLTGVSTALAMSAAVVEGHQQPTPMGVADWAQATWDAGRVVADKPLFDQVRAIVDAVESDTPITETLGKTAANIARGAIPASALVGGVAKAIDPTLRAAEGPVETVQRGIPGLSQRLPEKLDAFGQPVQRSQRYIESLVNPIARTSVQTDPIDEELRRLTTETGETPGPAPIARTARIAGQPLSRDERRQLQQLSGQAAYDALSRLISSGEYLRAKSDQARVELIRRELSAARTRAGEAVVPKALRPKKAS